MISLRKLNPFHLKNIDNLKSLIYIKELRPEMTQCRVIQIDKKVKEKYVDKI